MYMDITLKKGLNIPLRGEAKKKLNTLTPSKSFAIYPKDFHGITPKLMCKEGDEISLGQPLFYSKSNPELAKLDVEEKKKQLVSVDEIKKSQLSSTKYLHFPKLHLTI